MRFGLIGLNKNCEILSTAGYNLSHNFFLKALLLQCWCTYLGPVYMGEGGARLTELPGEG